MARLSPALTLLSRALTLLTLLAWLQPPAVLPLPSRSGPDGPPRPFGAAPPPGRQPRHTSAALVRAQDRALLYGPFPSGGLARGISDGGLVLSEHADVRALASATMRAAGASVARIPVDWRDVVTAAPPAGFDAGDPADPAYDFARIDAAVQSAVAAGLQPLLVVAHAPAFAEAPGRWPYAYPGSWAPDPGALQAFAAALARRYDGSFPDPLHPGAALPPVRLMQAWNEPNLARYLEPQWVVRGGRWRAFSPLLYRQLLDGFYDGVKSVAPHDTVVAAGIAPLGEPAGVGEMAPVAFLRTLLCLDGRPAHGGARPPASCPERPRFDVLAFHPLSVSNPDVPAASALDVAIADIAKVTRLLDAARRARTVLPAGPKPLWVTELNWQSPTGGARGVPPRLQAAWLSRGLHRLWVAGVSLVDWQFLVDPFGGVSLAGPTGSVEQYPRPAGLYYAGPGGALAGARPKPFLRGWKLPFDPLRVDRAHVRVWALPETPSQPVELERMAGGGWRAVASLRADRGGVVNALIALRGAQLLRVRSGPLVSAAAAVGRRRIL